MAATLQLNPVTWDLMLDANRDIALLLDPAPAPSTLTTAEAQAAACAIKLFLGEYYWDTTIGVPYLQSILGKNPTLALLKQYLVNAALTVEDISSAQVFVTSFNPTTRVISGQVQVVSTFGVLGAANFTVLNPQGAG